MTTREEAIRQLQSLRVHCRSMVRDEYEDVQMVMARLEALHETVE